MQKKRKREKERCWGATSWSLHGMAQGQPGAMYKVHPKPFLKIHFISHQPIARRTDCAHTKGVWSLQSYIYIYMLNVSKYQRAGSIKPIERLFHCILASNICLIQLSTSGLRRWFANATHRGTGSRIPPLPRAEFGRLTLEWHNWLVTPREGGRTQQLR